MTQTASAQSSANIIRCSANPINGVRMNCGAKIECVTPDGRNGHVSRLPVQAPGVTASITDDDTVTCLLQEGETNFVVELPQKAALDRFTFLNENAAASGELRISVSNHRLPAGSPEWTAVEGVIPFAHKRLFGVSLLGIQARFVRFSFRVAQYTRGSGVADHNPSPTRSASFSSMSDAGHSSASGEIALCKFAPDDRRFGAISLTAASPSVVPSSL